MHLSTVNRKIAFFNIPIFVSDAINVFRRRFLFVNYCVYCLRYSIMNIAHKLQVVCKKQVIKHEKHMRICCNNARFIFLYFSDGYFLENCFSDL